jgi:hypothetical protein
MDGATRKFVTILPFQKSSPAKLSVAPEKAKLWKREATQL